MLFLSVNFFLKSHFINLIMYLDFQQDDRFNLFKSIPTLEELRALGDEGLKADVILVDLDKDNKIKRLKKLAIVLERSNPAKAVKIIGDLVRIPTKIYIISFACATNCGSCNKNLIMNMNSAIQVGLVQIINFSFFFFLAGGRFL